MTDRLPVKPFMDWIDRRVERYEKEWEFGGENCSTSDAIQRTAFDLGLSTKTLGRYRRGLIETTRDYKPARVKVQTFRREEVEEALWRAGVFLWELYPEDEFPELYVIDECDPYPKPCVRCGEKVPTHDSRGQRLSMSKYKEKRFCGRDCYTGHKVEQIVQKECIQCGGVIPLRKPNGASLGPKAYAKRQFCDRECFEQWTNTPEGREAFSQRGRLKAA